MIKIIVNIQRRIPANMLWDRFSLDKKQAEVLAQLKTKNKKSTTDLAFVQDPHSA